MPSVLQTISVRRFKGIKVVELDVRNAPSTLLIGGNNSGKSSLLQALHFGVSVAQTAKLLGDQASLAWRQDRYELSFSPAQLLYSPVSDAMTLSPGGSLVEDANHRIEIVYATAQGTTCTVGVRRGRNRNLSVVIEGRDLGEELQSIENPFTIYAPGLAGLAREEEYKSPGVIRRSVARGDANLVLRNVLFQLSQDAEGWQSFLDDLQSIFPDLRVAIEFAEPTDEYVRVFFVTPEGVRLPLESAGTAILQTSQIFAYICLYKPALLLLDEPDSHLHPNNQRALCERLTAVAADRDFRIIASSHSRHVLDAFRTNAKVVWMHQGIADESATFEVTRMLMDLGALDSVDYFADGELRYLVATEDSDTAMLQAVLDAAGFPRESTTVVSYEGCSKIEAAQVLAQLLADKAPHVKLIIHRDNDYLSAEAISKLKQLLTANGASPLIPIGNDIESVFLNAEHLAELNDGLSSDRAAQLINEAIGETRNESIEAIVNLRTYEAFREKARGGHPVNHGTLATRAMTDYDASPRTFCRGKIVLGLVKAKIQQELGRNARVAAPSEHIRLTDVAELLAQEPGAA